jgi:hypothetical protein
MNVYFVVIYLIIFTWLIKLKKNVVSKNVDVLSIVFILFSWIAFLIVACFAVVIHLLFIEFSINFKYAQSLKYFFWFRMGLMLIKVLCSVQSQQK